MSKKTMIVLLAVYIAIASFGIGVLLGNAFPWPPGDYPWEDFLPQPLANVMYDVSDLLERLAWAWDILTGDNLDVASAFDVWVEFFPNHGDVFIAVVEFAQGL